MVKCRARLQYCSIVLSYRDKRIVITRLLVILTPSAPAGRFPRNATMFVFKNCIC